MFEYIIMGIVLNEELTGYDIKKRIETGIGNLYKASHGSLYPALKKLTVGGYLTMTEQMQGKRLKKYYTVTASGRAAFLEWLSRPYDPAANGENYLAKVFLLGELPRELRIKRLDEYEFYLRQQLGQLQITEKQIPGGDIQDRNYFEFSTFYYSCQVLQSTIKWIQHIKEQKPLRDFLQAGDELL